MRGTHFLPVWEVQVPRKVTALGGTGRAGHWEAPWEGGGDAGWEVGRPHVMGNEQPWADQFLLSRGPVNRSC